MTDQTKQLRLNEDQVAALEAMKDFVMHSEESFFVLSGHAGTGKTTCIRELLNILTGRIVFTAPTNKATRVLRETLRTPEYEPECCTIYSLLGLRMEQSGEVKVLAEPEEDSLDLSDYRIVVVDEAGMLNSQVYHYILMTAESACGEGGIPPKFIFMGDAAQLPPVGEQKSPIWDIELGAKLSRVMRHDNQILTLANNIRQWQQQPFARIDIRTDIDDVGGVSKLPLSTFHAQIAKYAKQGLFSEPGYCKALAWRNVIVDDLNRLIRKQIFDSNVPWLTGDRVIAARPVHDAEGNKVANTDDEGTVDQIIIGGHPLYPEFNCYHLYVTLDDNRKTVFWVLHEGSRLAFDTHKQSLSAAAKTATNRRVAWARYWDLIDNFHDIRYGYAITVHRSQGSTYEEVFVDASDILKNRDRKEALQCLYVACTRPKRRLTIC